MGAPLRTSGSLPPSPSMWEKGGAGIYPTRRGHTEGFPRHPDKHALVRACASHFSALVRLGCVPSPFLALRVLPGLQALLTDHRLFREAAPR